MPGDDAADDDQNRDRQRIELVHGDRRIGAERKEGGRAEIHIAAIAAKDVPGGRQHDILQHHIAGEEIIVVAEREGGGENRRADDQANKEEQVGAHR